ncbi:piggyBac transposable element-derived protein 3-like [Macrobrachium rosenbergii]|uniref:piggyBac transposable element-derived protein 3-like n=1 Tax=Macrobrachium rosenbergii TaxID=79674 RepID=UPI0034D62FDB
MIKSSMFYGCRNAALEHEDDSQRSWIAPDDAAGSDMDVASLEDDSDLDELSLYEDVPSTSRSRPCRKVCVVVPQQMPEDGDAVRPSTKRPRVQQWKKEDITNQPRQEYVHPRSDFLRPASEYFTQFFTPDLRSHIVFQSNLYSKQRDVVSNFNLSESEFMVFLGFIMYMGLMPLPSIVDYWAVRRRVPQVAEYRSRNRFKAIRSNLHFSDNDQAARSQDQFLKVRFLFTKITREFLNVAETPLQSVDEVMVAYKGTTAGNLRQYVAKKPDKWGFKLFCRSSVDGFIHDILMYQGATTFQSHHTSLSEEEEKLPVTNKFVIALVKTLKDPENSTVYADNYFTSIALVEYLRSQYSCWYVGTARDNRVGYPPLQSVKDMTKNSVARGTLDYVSSDGILVARGKDNRIVTILSTDVGVEPVCEVERYDKEVKNKVPVQCPNVINKYNSRMGGTDKSDMLVHLYKTRFKAKRYYMRLFAYIQDLIICNAWILYKRDCLALQCKPMPLKEIRLEICFWLVSFKTPISKVARASLGTRDVPKP